MGLFKTVVNSFFLAVLFLVIIFIGEVLFPGTLLKSAFTSLGVFVILIAVGLDSFFNLITKDL